MSLIEIALQKAQQQAQDKRGAMSAIAEAAEPLEPANLPEAQDRRGGLSAVADTVVALEPVTAPEAQDKHGALSAVADAVVPLESVNAPDAQDERGALSAVADAVVPLEPVNGPQAQDERGTATATAAAVVPLEPVAIPAVTPTGTRTPRTRVVLNREELRAQGLLPPVDVERRLAEEYRRIKRPLVRHTQSPTGEFDPRARIIMVASALPGDGKTFTAMNLALSLATEKDVNVLLIDGDVAKPQLSALLGLNDRLGLLDMLRDGGGTLDVEGLIADTDVPGLAVLGAGKGAELATELLASNRMKELMRDLAAADPRRLMVLDSPPLLLSNESRELSEAVGQVVLVVRAGVTPQQAVLAALERLDASKKIGVVLNQVQPMQGHVEYYGYGTYGAQYPERKDETRPPAGP